MIDKQAAFRLGFATELAERGWTPEMLMEKLADGTPVVSAAKALLGAGAGAAAKVPEAAGSGISLLGKLLGLGAVALPAAAGGTLGYLTTLPEQVEPKDIEALREQDLITSYRRAAEDLKARKARAAEGV